MTNTYVIQGGRAGPGFTPCPAPARKPGRPDDDAGASTTPSERKKIKRHQPTRVRLRQTAARRGGLAPARRMEQGGPQGTHIPPRNASPHDDALALHVHLVQGEFVGERHVCCRPESPHSCSACSASPPPRSAAAPPAPPPPRAPRPAPPVSDWSVLSTLNFYWSRLLPIISHPASRGRGLRRRLRSRPTRSRRSLRAPGARGALCLSPKLTVPHLI